MSLDEALLLTPAGDALEGRIDGSWWTPRGPLGGYVMALMMAGMRRVVAEEGRQPRSLTVSFLRPPAEGSFELRPNLERGGRSLSTVSARLEQDGKPVALALGSFSPAWPGPDLSEVAMPPVEAPDDSRAPAPGPGGLAPPGSDPRGNEDTGRVPPPFIQHMTMQPRFGSPPFSGADQGLTGGWLGLRERREVGAETVLILADAWYPAPWPRLTALAPAPTIEMSVYFRSLLPLPDSLLLGRFHTRLVRDGFFEEDGELWAPDGTLIAQSRQLGLLLGA